MPLTIYKKYYETTTGRCCFDLVSFATVSMKAPAAFEFNSKDFKQRCDSKIMLLFCFCFLKYTATSVDIQKVHAKKLLIHVDSHANGSAD